MTSPLATAAGVEADLAALLAIPPDFSSQPATHLPQRRGRRAGDRTTIVFAGTLMTLTIVMGLAARQPIDKPVPASSIPKASAPLVRAISLATGPHHRTPPPAEVAPREAPAGPVGRVRTSVAQDRGADAIAIGDGQKKIVVVALQVAGAPRAPPTSASVSPPAIESRVQDNAFAMPPPVIAEGATRERWTGIDAIRALRQR